MGRAGGRYGSRLLLDRTCMREGWSRDARTTLKGQRGGSQGVDDGERVAGCGFRSSDAGWLVDGKADERLFCKGWLMIAADNLKVRSMTVALMSIWEIGRQDLFPTRKNGRRS